MIKHQEIAYPDSCLNKAEHDEPIFVLRAKDPAAIRTIEHWIAQRICSGFDKEEDPKIQTARQLIKEMDRWQHDNPSKIKQLPDARKPDNTTGTDNDDHRTE